MDNTNEKKNPLSELMSTTMGKIRDMVDVNTIVGQPISTPDGVTLIPISRLSFGFGSGGGDYSQAKNFAGGSGAGVKIEPVAFLVVQGGAVRVIPVAVPPVSTADRIVEMAPDLINKVTSLFEKKKEEQIFEKD